MLELMDREHGLERRDALALASVVVDLRVTQLVNGVRGVHAILRDDALRLGSGAWRTSSSFRPRRGPDRGRGRALARRGGPGDRRGRPARRDRRPTRRRSRSRRRRPGRVSSILVAEGEVVPVGTVLVVIGETTAPASAAPRCRSSARRGPARARATKGAPVRRRRSSAGSRGARRRPRDRRRHRARRGASPRTDVRAAAVGAARQGRREPDCRRDPLRGTACSPSTWRARTARSPP